MLIYLKINTTTPSTMLFLVRRQTLWLEFGGEKQQHLTRGGGILIINVHFYMTEVIFVNSFVQDCSYYSSSVSLP